MVFVLDFCSEPRKCCQPRPGTDLSVDHLGTEMVEDPGISTISFGTPEKASRIAEMFGPCEPWAKASLHVTGIG